MIMFIFMDNVDFEIIVLLLLIIIIILLTMKLRNITSEENIGIKSFLRVPESTKNAYFFRQVSPFRQVCLSLSFFLSDRPRIILVTVDTRELEFSTNMYINHAGKSFLDIVYIFRCDHSQSKKKMRFPLTFKPLNLKSMKKISKSELYKDFLVKSFLLSSEYISTILQKLFNLSINSYWKIVEIFLN